jgi:hypothetical protein
MSDQDLSTMTVAYKVQDGFGEPATGAGAHGLEVLPSTGLAVAIAAIESAMIKRNRMKRRPRHGMKTVTTAYETELSQGPCDPIFECVLGGVAVPEGPFSGATYGALTITGGGLSGAFATGGLLASPIAAGMFVKFTGLGVAGNTGKWVPVIDVKDGIAKFAPGYLIDEISGGAWTGVIAKHISTPEEYVDTYVSVEEHLPTALMSKYGTDMRFHALNVSVDPKAYVKIGVNLTGRDMVMLSPTTDPVSPAFDDPDFIDNDSLILLDGGIYVNGVKRTDLTSLKFGLAAAVSSVGVIGTNVPRDVSLGQFAFTGDFTGVVADGADFESFNNEDDISILLHCKEKSTEAFVGFYIGYTSFAGYATPAGGEGLVIQTIPLFGGEDERGPGFLPTTVLISTAPA